MTDTQAETLLWESAPYKVTMIRYAFDDGLCHAILYHTDVIIADAAFEESYEAVAQSNSWMERLVTKAGSREADS